MAHAGFPIPLNEMGAFDVFGWQFLWVGGLALGETRFPTRWPRLLLTVSATLAAVLFVCRHAAFDKLTGPALFDLLVDKWKLGMLRLVNLAALGILLVRFGTSLANSRLGTRMAVLGRASLEVFSTHLICCFVFVGIGDGPDVHFTVSQDVAIVSITVAFMFVVAERVKRRRNAGADRASSAIVLTDITRGRGRSAARGLMHLQANAHVIRRSRRRPSHPMWHGAGASGFVRGSRRRCTSRHGRRRRIGRRMQRSAGASNPYLPGCRRQRTSPGLVAP
jgi:hypothetical protein